MPEGYRLYLTNNGEVIALKAQETYAADIDTDRLLSERIYLSRDEVETDIAIILDVADHLPFFIRIRSAVSILEGAKKSYEVP